MRSPRRRVRGSSSSRSISDSWASAAAQAAGAQQRTRRGALSASGWEDLAAVTAPITLVRGDRGFVTPADADEFRRRVPAASVIDVASGHNVQEEQPVALARLVARNT